MTEEERSPAGWQAHQAAALQVSKLQQFGLDRSQLVGVAAGTAQRPSGYHMAPTHIPELDPSLTSLLPSPQTPIPGDPKRGAVTLGGLWETKQLTPGCCLWSTHHLAQLSAHNSKLENGDKIILGRKNQSHKVSRGNVGDRNGFFRSLQKDFPKRSSSPTFVEPIWEYPPPPPPSHKVRLAALPHTHTVPGSFTGLAPGPRLCKQHSQPTEPGWVGPGTKSKDPCPASGR